MLARGPSHGVAARRRSVLTPAALLLLFLLAPARCLGQADGDDVVIGTYRQVPSRILGEDRRIIVGLPQGYEDSDLSYPVVVKLHGSPLSFFAPIQACLELLAESGRIPQVILVGVEQHGHWEVRPRAIGGPPLDVRGEEFLEFVTDELLPFVDENYRTKDLRILMGTYDCALFAVHALIEAPESFDAYLANNLHDYGFRDEPVLDGAPVKLAEGFESPEFLYVTQWHNEDGTADPSVGRFLAELEAAPPANLTWGSLTLEYPAHNTWIPYKDVERGMLSLFDGYRCPQEALDDGLKGVRSHYETWSARFGVSLDIPEMAFNNLSDHLVERHEWEEAIDVLLLFRETYPKSLNAAFRLARAYRGAGDIDNAIESYRAALEFDRCPPFFEEELRRLESSPAFTVERAMLESGLEAGLAEFRTLRSGELGEDAFREGEFNDVGYRFLGKGMAEEAIAVFRMNVELFPASANAYDSLGEAYTADGDTALAIASYSRSLEIEPDNASARETLRRLGESE